MPWLSGGIGGGGSLVPSDPVEFQILDRSAADIVNVANLALAEVQAGAQASAFASRNYGRYVITVDLTVVGAATELYVAARSSGKAAPLVNVPADWSYFSVDDIDRTTGESTTPPYVIAIPLAGVRRYTHSFRVWGSLSSGIVWCNGAGARGIVYAQRFVGS